MPSLETICEQESLGIDYAFPPFTLLYPINSTCAYLEMLVFRVAAVAQQARDEFHDRASQRSPTGGFGAQYVACSPMLCCACPDPSLG